MPSTSLNNRVDSMDMWSIENMELDMICGWLANSIPGLAKVKTRSCLGD